MVKNNFVAVDFETAQSPWQKDIFICQVGIAVVENGEITERISRLVQPPGNKYVKGAIATHGITPSMTKNEPSFDVVWGDISKYFTNTLLVAHNSMGFDEKVFRQNLDYYGISSKGINRFIDTLRLFNPSGDSLEALCHAFGFNCDNHHNAMYDAENCARIYLKFLNNEFPDNDLIDEYGDRKIQKKLSGEEDKGNFFKNRLVVDDELVEKIQITDEEFEGMLCPALFEGKKVINTGDLSCMSRKKFKEFTVDMGGTNGSVKSADIVVLGNAPGPAKVEDIFKMQESGRGITCINESQFEKFLKLIGYGG